MKSSISSVNIKYPFTTSLKTSALVPAETAAQSQQGFQDPLSAVVEAKERASMLSLDRPAGDHPLASSDCPTVSMDQQSTEAVDHDKNEVTESPSAWTPEVLQSDINHYYSLVCLITLDLVKLETSIKFTLSYIYLNEKRSIYWINASQNFLNFNQSILQYSTVQKS